MIKVRYVGSAQAQIMNTPYLFSAYGQSIGMPEEIFYAARAGRVHLLTEEKFQSLGHSPEELIKFAKFENHVRADDAFKSRLRQAWVLCQEDPLHDNPEAIAQQSPVVPQPKVALEVIDAKH